MTETKPDRTDEPEFVPDKTYGLYEWINRHPWLDRRGARRPGGGAGRPLSRLCRPK